MAKVFCPKCGNRLGEMVAGCYISKHEGRAIIALGDFRVQCEDCKAVSTREEIEKQSVPVS